MKERLKEYIKEDVVYNEYKQGKENFNDFEKYCIQHCQDIEEILKKNEEYKEIINKAIEKIQLLIDIGFDYDGLNQVSSLKGLIDELVSYAIDSRDILKGDSNE